MPEHRLTYLYTQYIKAKASEQEVEEMFALAKDPQNELLFHSLMESSWTELEEIEERIALAGQAPVVIPFHKRTWTRIAVAAVFILAIATTWLLIDQPSGQGTGTGTTAAQVQHDAAPGKDGAILTLADGTQIILDDAANGQLATQNGTAVVKEDGTISYSPSGVGGTYNTMSTPNGRQYSLVLPDGSKVWLNAASSITFPTAFVGKERRVEITGEAYFEVAKDASKPFHVLTKDQDVTVLGTHFNINSYDDEEAIKTTLLEGSVKVSVIAGNTTSLRGTKQSVVLKPGQQSILSPSGVGGNSPLTIHHSPDIENVLAWKNGMFNFTNADITEIMKQAARWYDVEVKYQGTTSKDKFKGKISRNTNLSQLLKILEINGVKWKIEGKVVTITN